MSEQGPAAQVEFTEKQLTELLAIYYIPGTLKFNHRGESATGQLVINMIAVLRQERALRRAAEENLATARRQMENEIGRVQGILADARTFATYQRERFKLSIGAVANDLQPNVLETLNAAVEGKDVA